jgi:hypothetical protein
MADASDDINKLPGQATDGLEEIINLSSRDPSKLAKKMAKVYGYAQTSLVAAAFSVTPSVAPTLSPQAPPIRPEEHLASENRSDTAVQESRHLHVVAVTSASFSDGLMEFTKMKKPKT